MSASYSKIYLALFLVLAAGACSSTPNGDSVQPIANPFKGFDSTAAERNNNIKFKSHSGDATYEVDVPNTGDSDVVVPFAENSNGLGSGSKSSMMQNGIDYQYRDSKPSMADREIASTFTKGANSEAENKRQEIEQGLGLQETEADVKIDQSYLAKVDVVKQLFKAARYEAALLELDRLVQEYPNNSRLYEMRGTVLDRLGYADLAMKSWRQALEFNPGRLGLKKLVEKREQQRNIASEKGKN